MMNGPYHPRSTLSETDLQILRKKDKLKRINAQIKDPDYHKKKAEKERLRRKKKREEDPVWAEEQRQKARDYYRKNPQKQIQSTLKWNAKNRDRKNATNKRSYWKNRDKILAKRKEKRKIAREATENA